MVFHLKHYYKDIIEIVKKYVECEDVVDYMFAKYL
jgi:hypothetical protein